jgi:hypothetical protein
MSVCLILSSKCVLGGNTDVSKIGSILVSFAGVAGLRVRFFAEANDGGSATLIEMSRAIAKTLRIFFT